MPYQVLYGDDYIFDPFTVDATIFDATLTANKNASAYFDFSIVDTHPLADSIQNQGDFVRVYYDGKMLFKGLVTSKEQTTEGYWNITCTDNLQFLSDTVVRPYSTVVGEAENEAPVDPESYFEWLIQQHNNNVRDERKQFIIDVNQANSLLNGIEDDDYEFEASSDSLPTTASEIENQILDSLGGYLFLIYPEQDEDATHICLYADLYQSNDQVIDFGVNILDFSHLSDSEEQYTAVRPQGGNPELDEETITYQQSSSGSNIPTGTWYETELDADAGGYVWIRTIDSYSDGGYSVSYEVDYEPEESDDDDDETAYSSSSVTSYCLTSSGTDIPTSGWVTQARTTASEISAGMKLYLNDTPLYSSATSATRTKLISGTYYLWDTTLKNGRYRITDASANVGDDSEITGWVDSKWVTDETSYIDTIYSYTGGQYLWTRVVETFSDGASTTSYDVAYQTDFDISIEDYTDGEINGYDGFFKEDDIIYNAAAVQTYGYKEYCYSNSEITDIETLIQKSIADLKKVKDPEVTVEVKAIDLAIYMDGYEHLQIGQGVRIRSELHNIDEYLVVSSITLDLQDPSQSEYTLGKEYDTLTGETSGFLQTLNSSINTAYDSINTVETVVSNTITNITQITDTVATMQTTTYNISSAVDILSSYVNGDLTSWTTTSIDDIASIKVVYDILNSTLEDLSTTMESWSGVMSTITMGELADGTPCLDLSTSANDYLVRITNEGMYFYEGSNVIAYMNNESMYITTAVIENDLDIGGNWWWSERENGNLGLRYLTD